MAVIPNVLPLSVSALMRRFGLPITAVPSS